MGVRRQAREAAVQALYMCDALGRWTPESASFCFEHFDIADIGREYAEALCVGVIEHVSKIDSQLTCASEHWSINRMGRVDRAILRVAAYELIYVTDIPAGVAINEAIEIAKRFSAVESPTFVNGVLDKVARLVEAKPLEQQLKHGIRTIKPRTGKGTNSTKPSAIISASTETEIEKLA